MQVLNLENLPQFEPINLRDLDSFRWIVFTGANGTGKTTLLKEIFSVCSDNVGGVFSDINFSPLNGFALKIFKSVLGVVSYLPHEKVQRSDFAKRIYDILCSIRLGKAAENSQGTFVIDNFDLRLHIETQKRLISGLQTAYPNIQFIVSANNIDAFKELPNALILEISINENNGLSRLDFWEYR